MLVDVTRGCEFHGDPTGGWEKGSPPPKSNGYFFMCRGFFGGRGIAHPPSSSHPRCVHQHCRRVLRKRKDWHLSLPPHNVEEFSGGGGTGPPPHTAGLYLGGRRTGLLPHNNGDYLGGGGTGPPPHNVGKFHRGAVLTQMGRPGDTMICEKATFCTRVQFSAARDALRYHAVGVQVVRGQDRAGLSTVGTLRRHHGLWVGLRFAHGCRSEPLRTLCDTMWWVCVVDRGQYRIG